MQINAYGSGRGSQHSFAQIPDVRIPRTAFNRTSSAKDTMNFDELTPVFMDAVIPGDTHSLTTSTFMRLATQLVPIMDNMYVDFFYFFVPNRLVYSNWEKMCGAQDNPGDSTSYIFPQLTLSSAQCAVGTIYDHFGLTTNGSSLTIKNTLPLRAYNLIWNPRS